MRPNYSATAGFCLILVLFLGGCGRTETAHNQAGGTSVMADNRGGDNANRTLPEVDKSRLPTPDSPYVKVYITKSGEITLDGKTVTLDEVGSAFAALAGKRGVVLYSRESPTEAEPHPNAMRVVNLITTNSLPVRMCLSKDCADALDSQGKLLIGK